MTDYGKGDINWFVHDRFGMFIHWGIYSLPARHEWIRNIEEISNEDYQKYADFFDPDLFNPEEWARTAFRAGMRYVVVTAKHHDGFCMWDSRFTDYKVTNTPCGRDLLREILEAFRKYGLKTGIYYSFPDWHHDQYTIDKIHPLRNHPDRDRINQKRDIGIYRKYVHDQVRELLTSYGKIDILWFDQHHITGPDGKGHETWDSEGLVRMIRSLQPDILLNERLDIPDYHGDFRNHEANVRLDPVLDEQGNPVAWEGCQTFSGSWGYFRDETTWKTVRQCIVMLINHVSRGGNLLMNVGPTARGYFDERAMNCLDGFARWMKYHAKAIYGCGMARDLCEPRDCRYTYDAGRNRLYVHILEWPAGKIQLSGMAGKIRYAQFLHDGSEVIMKQKATEPTPFLAARIPEDAVVLVLPVIKPAVEIPVVELILE